MRQREHRGGTALLIRRSLQHQVLHVDTGIEDQVWLRLSCIPGVLFGFCYVPPSDSSYFNPDQFSSIQEKLKGSVHDTKFFIIGDLNARFGSSVRNLVLNNRSEEGGYSYPHIPDPVRAPNGNANTLATICAESELIVVNNLRTPTSQFSSELTYRKGLVWKSELDTCIVSPSMLYCLSEFRVWQDMTLPSDHAPISVNMCPPQVDLMSLGRRANVLGDHATLHNQQSNSVGVRRPFKFTSINSDLFCRVLSQRGMPQLRDGVDSYADSVSNVLYSCIEASRYQVAVATSEQSLERWERLISDQDDCRIWRAIDWKGEYRDIKDTEVTPTDDQFKNFFEDLYNPPGEGILDVDDSQTQTTIPVLDDNITVEEVKCQIQKLKPDKACGSDGICPGILKVLPAEWIILYHILLCGGLQNYLLFLRKGIECCQVIIGE